MCPSENVRNSINSVNYIVTSGDNAILLSAISMWFKSNICSSFPKYHHYVVYVSSKTVFLWLQIALNITTKILKKKCTEIFLNSFEHLYKDYNMAFWPRCPQYLCNEDFHTQEHCGGLRRIDDKLEEQIFDAHKAPWEKRKMNFHFFCLTLPIVLCVNL